MVKAQVGGLQKIVNMVNFFFFFIFKNKKFFFLATFSAAASIGLIYRWDIDNGLSQCDRYLYSSDDFVRVSIKILTVYFIFFFYNF